MTFLLDTNTCIRYLNGRSANVNDRLQATPAKDVVVCSIVKAELFYGAMKSSDPARTFAKQQKFLRAFKSLPFDDEAAEAYGRIRAALARAGTLIGPNDLIIAAIAIANDVTVVTHKHRRVRACRRIANRRLGVDYVSPAAEEMVKIAAN